MIHDMRFDAVIGGGGPAGLTMALALAQVCRGDLRVALADRGPVAAADDPRAWALSAASVRLLRALGVWQAVAGDAQAVTEIEITDSTLEAGIRPVLLRYDNHTASGEPAAYIVPNQALMRALLSALEALGHGAVSYYQGHSLTSFEADNAAVTATLDDGTSLCADLVIAADGRNSALRRHAGIKTVEWQYGQRGIVTTVSHQRPHGGKAVQHFLPGGPFAILPLPGEKSCITWSEQSAVAERIMQLDDAGFLAEVQQRFGGKLGLLELAGTRGSFPLAMHLARAFVAPRFALIGDTAHGVHPIAGQGLNLALRDVAALAECVADGVQSGLTFGDLTVLERYQSWRRFDSTLAASTFDAINRIFSNDTALLRSMREAGLGVVDRLPELKRFFVNEAAGLSGELPRLMR